MQTDVTNEVLVIGAEGSTQGIFDPSLVYPGDAPGGAMAYTSVPTQDTLRTRIALSADHGATWYYSAEANTPQVLTISSSDAARCPGGTCSGKLIHEVSSLVLDPLDPNPNRVWKLFTHAYMFLDGAGISYEYGAIMLSTSPQPQGPWSAAQKLIGWNSPSPISSDGAGALISAYPAFADCVVLTEPTAMFAPDGALYLALGCVHFAPGPAIRIILTRSADHAQSFEAIGTLLHGDDAECLGAGQPRVNAANLMLVNGQPHLVVSRDAPPPLAYQGCDVIRITDLNTASVEREADGSVRVLRRFEAPNQRFSGACAFAEGATSVGYAVSVGFFEDARRFRILRAPVTAP